MCWGAKDFSQHQSKALIFKVNGLLFQGVIVIILGWMDTYTVRYVDKNGVEALEMDEDVYFDDLTNIIDAKIERANG